MAGKVNLDLLIDWDSFFSTRLPYVPKAMGDHKRGGLCPFHSEKDASFWFRTDKPFGKCESQCGGGNAHDFLVKTGEAADTKEAHKILLRLAGVDGAADDDGAAASSSTGGGSKPCRAPETLESFARAKHFDAAWLREMGLRDGRYYGTAYVGIPYKDKSGAVTALRRRFGADGETRFLWKKGATLSLFGLWLPLNKNAQTLVLVEGESDALSLWSHGVPALGVPGASTFQSAWVDAFRGASRVLLHHEPDNGGAEFVQKTGTALRAAGFAGEVCEISVNDAWPDCKDVSDLHVLRSADWDSAWEVVLSTARPVSVTDKLIEGATVAKPAKQIAPLETFSAADIVASDAEPPRQIVLGVLTEGLSILCGKPKLGKSWLGLSLALCVSAGVPFLGHSVDGGSCLYFDLEGSKARLKSRISAIWNGDVPRGLQVAFRTSETLAGGGILEQIAKWADSVENPKLVVIDTLGRAKGFAGNRSANAYEVDTTIYSPLAQFALDRHIAVLGVHHLRKMATVDGLDAVSGSLGLPGVCDCFWLLSRPRLGDDSENGTLQIGGRDLQDAEMLLRWQKPGWALLAEDGAAYTAKQRYATSEIVTAIKAFARDWHTGDYWEGRASDFLVECAKLKIPCSATAVEFSKGLREFASKLYAETGLLVRFVRFKKGNGFSLERPIADGF